MCVTTTNAINWFYSWIDLNVPIDSHQTGIGHWFGQSAVIVVGPWSQNTHGAGQRAADKALDTHLLRRGTHRSVGWCRREDCRLSGDSFHRSVDAVSIREDETIERFGVAVLSRHEFNRRIFTNTVRSALTHSDRWLFLTLAFFSNPIAITKIVPFDTWAGIRKSSNWPSPQAMTAFEFIREIHRTPPSCEMVTRNTSPAWHGGRWVPANWRLGATLASFCGNWILRAIHCAQLRSSNIWNSRPRFSFGREMFLTNFNFLSEEITIQSHRSNGITRAVCWLRLVSVTQTSSCGRSTPVDVFHSNASESRALSWNGHQIAIACVHRRWAMCSVFGAQSIGSQNVGPSRMGRFNRLRGRHARITWFLLSPTKRFCIVYALSTINCTRVSSGFDDDHPSSNQRWLLKNANFLPFSILTQLQRRPNNHFQLPISPKRIADQMRSVAFRKAFAGIRWANTLRFYSRIRRMWRYSAQPSIESTSTYRRRFSSAAIATTTSKLHSYASSLFMGRRRKWSSLLAGHRGAFSLFPFCVENNFIFNFWSETQKIAIKIHLWNRISNRTFEYF